MKQLTKKTCLLVFVFLSIINLTYAADKIDNIKLDIAKNHTVDEAGMVLEFLPDKDGDFIFINEVEQKQAEDNMMTNFWPLEMTLFDDEMNVVASNVGLKSDIYNKSYNSGDTIAIGQGTDPDEKYYYNQIKHNCYAGQVYCLRLDIPEVEQLTDMQEEILGDDYKITRNTSVLVSYDGLISSKNSKVNSEGNDNEGSKIIIYFLLGVAFVLMFIIAYKRSMKIARKNSTDKMQSQTAKNINQSCLNCGSKLEDNNKFCTLCGKEIQR